MMLGSCGEDDPARCQKRQAAAAAQEQYCRSTPAQPCVPISPIMPAPGSPTAATADGGLLAATAPSVAVLPHYRSSSSCSASDDNRRTERANRAAVVRQAVAAAPAVIGPAVGDWASAMKQTTAVLDLLLNNDAAHTHLTRGLSDADTDTDTDTGDEERALDLQLKQLRRECLREEAQLRNGPELQAVSLPEQQQPTPPPAAHATAAAAAAAAEWTAVMSCYHPTAVARCAEWSVQMKPAASVEPRAGSALAALPPPPVRRSSNSSSGGAGGTAGKRPQPQATLKDSAVQHRRQEKDDELPDFKRLAQLLPSTGAGRSAITREKIKKVEAAARKVLRDRHMPRHKQPRPRKVQPRPRSSGLSTPAPLPVACKRINLVMGTRALVLQRQARSTELEPSASISVRPQTFVLRGYQQARTSDEVAPKPASTARRQTFVLRRRQDGEVAAQSDAEAAVEAVAAVRGDPVCTAPSGKRRRCDAGDDAPSTAPSASPRGRWGAARKVVASELGFDAEIGCRVGVWDDKAGDWYQAKIVGTQEKPTRHARKPPAEVAVFVHFEGWSSKYHLWHIIIRTGIF
jgi:hypothetical protein